jgi:TnpA family transposase
VEGGDIFCRDSVRFRSINDDLIDEELWRTSKEELIAKAGLDILCQPIGKHLAELKERLETRLSEVNRRIATGLPIFRHYDIGGALHSSSDGQKFETAVRTFNARHSPKYFGLKKGIVSYTLVANNVPVNARNISADDHESHFVFDIIHNNSTDIQPDIHSADTHATNQANFALLHVFGDQFAPRYKDICDKVQTSLTAFHHPSRYDDAVLKPIRKIREDLIVREWDECQRIFVSLALKETTQSTIVRKLSAQSRNGRAKRALWEYDSIHRSLYLLDYIDCPPLR